MKATEVMHITIPMNRGGEPKQEGLEALADALDEGWITIGGGVPIAPCVKLPHGSVVFFLKRCSTHKK